MVALTLAAAVLLPAPPTPVDQGPGTIVVDGGEAATFVVSSPDPNATADTEDAAEAGSTVALVGWAIVVLIGAFGAYAWWRGRRAVRSSELT